jgi:hypothetical protein
MIILTKTIKMKKLLILLGLADEQPPKTIEQTRFISTYPDNQPPLHDWCKEFRFGMLYDRRAIYMN